MDLKSRLRNKTFLLTFFSTLLLLSKQLGLNIFPPNASDVFNTILLLLALLGVVIDPSTPGITDKVETKEGE